MGGDLVADYKLGVVAEERRLLIFLHSYIDLAKTEQGMQSSQVKFLQLLHLSNEGATAKEIAEGFPFI